MSHSSRDNFSNAIYIALGSNQGDSKKHLLEAKNFLTRLSTNTPEFSKVYTTEPIGPSSTDFLNAVAKIESELTPLELLKKLNDQERQQGRPSRYPKWTSRTLDLDIIDFKGYIDSNNELILPHPALQSRLFVLLPLSDITPNWIHPVSQQPIQTLIERAEKMRIETSAWQWE